MQERDKSLDTLACVKDNAIFSYFLLNSFDIHGIAGFANFGLRYMYYLCTLLGKICRNISDLLLLGQNKPLGFPNKTTTTNQHTVDKNYFQFHDRVLKVFGCERPYDWRSCDSHMV